MVLKHTNNTRILVRKTCILLYFIHGPAVLNFSILDVLRDNAIQRAPPWHDDLRVRGDDHVTAGVTHADGAGLRGGGGGMRETSYTTSRPRLTNNPNDELFCT